jgi:hypothetical protein
VSHVCGVRRRGALVCGSKAVSVFDKQRASTIRSRGGEMKIRARYWGLGTLLVLAAALMLLVSLPSSAANPGNPGKGHAKNAATHGAKHVRWDIISLVGGNFPGPANPGGSASASAPGPTPGSIFETITLTGNGTFVAPAGKNGGNSSTTGGGTWRTSHGASGTYVVTRLVSFAFANLQTTPPAGITDNIGDVNKRANGTAVLKIRYSDGSSGVLTVGCHGPGAPDGIFEGIAVTKGYVTYYIVAAPAPGVDANRTIFHLLR